jgi:glycosyltransferase involved in cell wall biosynthesis
LRIVTILSTPIPPTEGIGFYAWNLARFLTRQGHQVHIITRGDSKKLTKKIIKGITIWKPVFLPAYPFHVYIHGLFVNALLKKMEFAVDLFHIHSPLPPVITTKRPVMVSFHSTIFEDVRETRIRDLYTFLMRIQAPISIRHENGNLRRAESINAISPSVAENLRNYPYALANIQVVWNGVDINVFKPGIKRKNKNRFIFFAGRLVPGKGIEDLIHAFLIINRECKSIKLVIAGEGSRKKELEKFVTRNNLNQYITILGHVFDRQQLVELYQNAALFVLPSHHEGLPTVVLEAMACGCPVVATCVGGLNEVISDGINGKLVAPFNPDQLAKTICKVLDDPSFLASMGAKARQTIEDRFSWETIGSHFLKEYEGMVS